MNREIKFRIWNTGKRYKKGMFTWEEIVDSLMSELNPLKSLLAPLIQSEQFQENPWMVLMQFTGLKDKNGKEIYEGDIVAAEEEGDKNVYEVIWWGDNYPAFDFRDWDGDTNGLNEMANNGEMEVIGNIYEGLYSGEKSDMIGGWKNNTEKQSQSPLKDTELAKKQREKLD